jgi:predicted ribosome quality control (RQC) complex YloA/Tae2 family protein
MKESITSLDLMFLTRELKEKLVGGKIQGIKQMDKTFAFEIYKQERFFLKLILPKMIYVTETSQQSSPQPSSFCMQLRKHLMGKTISNVNQYEFDRIVEVETDGYKIIFELFSTGNLILTDSSGLIIGILEQQEWKDRILKVKSIYKHPPSNINPFKHDFFEFQKILRKIDKETVKTLAVDFGLGGTYAEEFCKKLEIDKNKKINQLTQQETDKLFRMFEQMKTLDAKPFVFMEERKAIDVAPFDMLTYSNNEKVEFNSFLEAIEAYFEGLKKVLKERKETESTTKEEKRVENIQEKQLLRLKALQEEEQNSSRAGQLLYGHYQIFEEILNGINKLKEEKDWNEIKEIIKSQDTEESKMIKELRPEDARVVAVIDNTEVELDFRKSVEENANSFFEDAKRMKKKIEGLQKVIGKIPEKQVKEKIEPKKKISKKWFERYRWFYSSNGILCIAGKNARNNETIVKRYTRPQDLVMHVDIQGSPFVVIRNDQKLAVIPAETIYEAAEFAAAYSRAWDQKVASISVYYIRPEQVVKEAGLPLGSFMIRGERKWLEKIKPRLSIGIKQEEVYMSKLISGPVTAVKKQTPYLVTIVPGDRTADDLAKEIKNQLLMKVPFEIKKPTEEIELEEIKKIIPYGKGELVR